MAGMNHDDVALVADARWFILQQEYIGRRVSEGIADDLVERGIHESWPRR
jgi:hypothetical protein